MSNNMSSMTDLETIQIAVFLGFCARRNSKISGPDMRNWLHFAISRLKAIHKTKDGEIGYDAPQRRQWKRIWWTCYLYEHLDVFNSTNNDLNSNFQLDHVEMPPLTLDDF